MYRVEVFDSNEDLILSKEFDSFDAAYETAVELPEKDMHIQIRDTVTDHITSISFVREGE